MDKIKNVLERIRYIQNWPMFVWPMSKKLPKVAHLRNGLSFWMRNSADFANIIACAKDDYGLENLKDPKVIIDIGCYIGTFALLAKKKFPQAHVYCFEPMKESFKALQENIALNGVEIQAYNMAVSDVAGQMDINMGTSADAPSLYRDRGLGRTLPVQVTTLPAFMQEQHIQCIDCLKIEAEGAEYKIIPQIDMNTVGYLTLEEHPRDPVAIDLSPYLKNFSITRADTDTRVMRCVRVG